MTIGRRVAALLLKLSCPICNQGQWRVQVLRLDGRHNEALAVGKNVSPAPSGDTTSYGPSLVPAVRATTTPPL